ncbi:MAG: hypothetical protein ACI80V_002079 [Rhodothermales bacterium]|jgi:hypothetical protein
MSDLTSTTHGRLAPPASIYVIHENGVWVEPLRAALEEVGVPFAEWFLDEGVVPFEEDAPPGVFYNRMSASSHIRGHRYGPELTHAVLNWLERDRRRVINGSRALYLEISKLAQYAGLQRFQIHTPRTQAAVGRDAVLTVAKGFGPGPFLLKPNRGGSGRGVRLFSAPDEVAAFLDAPDTELPIDGIWLVQEFIQGLEPVVIRCEFVGRRFLYALRIETGGGFELCPADVCVVEGTGRTEPTFDITHAFDRHPIIEAYGRFLQANQIEIAGIEFIQDHAGTLHTYDVNTNTNYNADAEARSGVPVTGMQAIARLLADALRAEAVPRAT